MSNSTISDVNEIDYGYEVETSGGLYLRLKTKGQKARVRLIGNPISFKVEFTGDDGKPVVKQNFAWCVIDKSVPNAHAVRVYEGGKMIFIGIKDHATDPEYGDPSTYDFIITRTEVKGSYYTVKAAQKGNGPLTEDDFALLKEAGVDPNNVSAWLRPLIDKSATGEGEAPKGAGGPDEYDPFADE